MQFFFHKILAKYSTKRTKLHHFLKFSRGSMPPNPPNKRVALPRAAWRFAPCKYPHFYKKYFEPPPRNEILDTPLVVNIQYNFLRLDLIPKWLTREIRVYIIINQKFYKDNLITCYNSIRRGRLCVTSHVRIGNQGTFRFRGI